MHLPCDKDFRHPIVSSRGDFVSSCGNFVFSKGEIDPTFNSPYKKTKWTYFSKIFQKCAIFIKCLTESNIKKKLILKGPIIIFYWKVQGRKERKQVKSYFSQSSHFVSFYCLFKLAYKFFSSKFKGQKFKIFIFFKNKKIHSRAFKNSFLISQTKRT